MYPSRDTTLYRRRKGGASSLRYAFEPRLDPRSYKFGTEPSQCTVNNAEHKVINFTFADKAPMEGQPPISDDKNWSRRNLFRVVETANDNGFDKHQTKPTSKSDRQQGDPPGSRIDEVIAKLQLSEGKSSSSHAKKSFVVAEETKLGDNVVIDQATNRALKSKRHSTNDATTPGSKNEPSPNKRIRRTRSSSGFSSDRNEQLCYVTPPKEVFSGKDVIHVKSIDDVDCLFTVAGSIVDYLFVYEFQADRHESTTRLSMMKRWRRCKNIYFVMQGTQQCGCAKHLENFHFQMHSNEVVKSLSTLIAESGDDIPDIKIIGPNASYEDCNICVKNMNEEQMIISPQLLLNTLSKTSAMSTDKTRQHHNADFGYCSSISCGRRLGCDLGLVRPRKFRASVLANEILSQTQNVFDCCVDSIVMDGFSLDESRRRWFAAQLNESNVFEGIRIHKTFMEDDVPFICKPHCDAKNSKADKLSTVMWWSSLVRHEGKLMRIGLVGYWKASVDEYFLRRQEHQIYLQKCKHALRTFAPERRCFFGNNLRQQQEVPFFECLPISRSRCNLKIESYYQPFVFAISSVLVRYPRTSLHEIISISMAIARTLCSASFTSAAIRMLFAQDPATTDKGWWLVKKFCRIDEVHEDGDMKLTLRFGKYGKFGLPVVDNVTWSRRDWREAIERLVCEFELVRRLPKIEQEDYNRLHRHIQRIPMVGTLSSNHIIGICSIVGILPLSMFPLVNGGADKFLDDLEDSLQLSGGRSNETVDGDKTKQATSTASKKKNKKKRIKKKDRVLPRKEIVMDNVRHLCEVELDRGPITKREAENQCCKIGRMLSQSDNRYWDISESLCPTFEVDCKGEQIKYSNGTERQGSILNFVGGIWQTNFSFHILSNKVRKWMEQYN